MINSQYNARGQLSSSQLRFLRRRGIVQILIFAFLLVILCPMGAYGVWLFATEPRPQDVPVLAVALMILLFAALGLMGLSFGWLALAMIPHLANLSKVRVEYFDDVPNKDTFRLRPPSRPFGYRTFTLYLPGQILGTWLNHAGRAYAMDLSLFQQIPDEGFFRFYYIRRPYLPLFLSPYEVINFEPLSTEGGEMALLPRSEGYQMENAHDRGRWESH